MGLFDKIATAILIPVVAPFAIAEVIYEEVTNSSNTDEYETSTYSNKSEKEAEAKEYERANKKERIRQEVQAYKNQQRKRLKKKYNVSVKIKNTNIEVNTHNDIFNNISILENETAEIIKLIETLEVERNEAIR